MLRRPEGATVAQSAETTGWASHTVRGFFAGLKKKVIAVAMLERVRQVGPNKKAQRAPTRCTASPVDLPSPARASASASEPRP
jgi:hypothetical protein